MLGTEYAPVASLRPPRAGRSHCLIADRLLKLLLTILLLVLASTATACGLSGPSRAVELRAMSDGQVADDLEADPESAEAQYVRFILRDGGLRPPTGVTPRTLLIFAYEECAGLSPSPPPEWRRERLGEPVGFENFVHTARGFAGRLICPDGP